MKTHHNLKGSAILCLAALLWGLAFVAQSNAADLVPPLVFNGLRSLIGALFLLGFLAVRKKRSGTPIFPTSKSAWRTAIAGGILCGVLLTVSVNLQQFGLVYYPEGVAGAARASFLTALYVVLVPILSFLSQRRVQLPILGAVLVAMGGIYLLCLSGGWSGIYFGDVLVLLCAFTFTFHILAVDRFADPVGGVRLSMLQFVVCGVLSLLLSLIFEWDSISLSNIVAATPSILYMGIVSSGIAYTLQIVGQRYAEPAFASLSMSLESVFGALGGWLILGNTLTKREFFGCALVFAAIILAQLPQLLQRKQVPSKENKGQEAS